MPQFKLPVHYQHIKTIHLAAKLGVLPDVQQMLYEKPELIHEIDFYGNNCLYYSCLCGHVEVAHYLLKLGAKDDSVNRSYRNALNFRIRDLLKKYLVYDKSIMDQDKQRKKKKKKSAYESMDVAMYNLFDEIDAASDVDHLQHNSTVNSSDVKIAATYNGETASSTEQKVYDCHMSVLVSRWKYFRKLLIENEARHISDQELTEIITKQINKYRYQTIFLDNLKPEIFNILLRYIYTNDFVTGLDAFINPSNKKEMERVTQLMKDLLYAALRFELNELVTLIVEECMMLNVSFDTEKIIDEYNKSMIEKNNNYRKRNNLRSAAGVTSVGRSFRNSVVTPSLVQSYSKNVLAHSTTSDRKAKTKKNQKSSSDNSFYYESIDFKVQRMAMKELSDIVIQSRSNTSDEEFNEPIFCHKLLLSSRSTYFNVLLNGPFRDLSEMTRYEDTDVPIVYVDDIPFSILLILIRYLYTEDLTLTASNAFDVLFAATKLDLMSLKSECEKFIATQLHESNCTQLFYLADALYATDLKLKALDFMLQLIHDNGKEYWEELSTQLKQQPDASEDTINKLRQEVHNELDIRGWS
jgi:hypothetical protein